jgi:uncharacterized protein (TIGR03435 family)
MTKTIVAGSALFLVLALAMAVKFAFFPSVKDTYFAMDERNLEKVPARLLIIRPTHFSLSIFRRGIIRFPNSGTPTRIMGRNVSLRDMIAVAWQEDAARIQMPASVPTNDFDFIVTVSQPRKQLQKAIREELGYTANKETIETEVLALKIEDSLLPGLTVSAADEKENGDYKKGRLYVTHMGLNELARGFEQVLKTPVMDKTGLTNCYDFSLPWTGQFLKQLRDDSTARPAVDKLLADWGLGLEPDKAPMEMLVVKYVH